MGLPVAVVCTSVLAIFLNPLEIDQQMVEIFMVQYDANMKYTELYIGMVAIA